MYATQQDLEDRYGTDRLIALTDRAEVPTGAINAALVARVLANADALIDGYLKVRYDLPLATTPDQLQPIAEAIAYYDLHLYEPNEKTKADHKLALEMLKDISKGVIQLEVGGVEPDVNDAGGVTVTDRDRPFTADNMKGFI